MVGIAVIAGQFFADTDPTFSIKFNPAIGDANIQVRIAGVIDILKRAIADTAIDGVLFTDVDNYNTFGRFGATPPFAC